jgi:hypothetical protein
MECFGFLKMRCGTRPWRRLELLLLVFACVFVGHNAHARYQEPKSFFFQGLSTQMKDIGSSSTSNGAFPHQLQEAELGLRVMGIFSISAIGERSQDNTMQGFGGGLRIDLPGFFFIGADDRDLRKKAKSYPVNTSIFMQTISIQYKPVGQTTALKNTTTRYGVTIELFPFQQMVYVSLEGGLYNYGGNSYALTGAGLGMQF